MSGLKAMPHADLSLIKGSFKQRYEELLKDRYDEFVRFSFSYARKSIRVNTLKMGCEELVSRLEHRWHLEAVPWCKDGFWISYKGDDIQDERFDIGNLPEHALGYFYVQDAASMIPPVVLQPIAGECVLDLCAAPGSKTSQIASLMDNKGLLVGNDPQASRLRPLSVNLQRLGVRNTVITHMRGQAFARKGICFDKVLVDAPCSGTGTIRRSMKTLKMWSPGLVSRLVKEQQQLIRTAFEVLKVGGSLVYSTCTQEPEENEGVVSWLLDNYADAVLLPIDLPMKRSPAIQSFQGREYHNNVKNCLRIYPMDNDTEGFFVAHIQKKE